MGKKKNRVSIEEGDSILETSPFDSLDLGKLPVVEPKAYPVVSPNKNAEKSKSNRGRVDVVRQRSAGGGGWMTVAKNFVGISLEEKKSLKKQIQKKCGVGGSVKNGCIEIQGDNRESVRDILEQAGFRVVYAGG